MTSVRGRWSSVKCAFDSYPFIVNPNGASFTGSHIMCAPTIIAVIPPASELQSYHKLIY